MYEATKMPMIRLIVIFIKSIRAREISLDRKEKRQQSMEAEAIRMKILPGLSSRSAPRVIRVTQKVTAFP